MWTNNLAAASSVAHNLNSNLGQVSAAHETPYLAQTDQQKYEPHSCSFSQDRNQLPLEDFYGILEAGEPYTDYSFPRDDAYYWADDVLKKRDHRTSYLHSHYADKQWMRAYDAFPNGKLVGD